MKNILIPTDFSVNSWNAIQYALELFKKMHCTFYLFHVCRINMYAGGDVPVIPSVKSIENTVVKDAKLKLKELLKRIEHLPFNTKHNFITLAKYDFFVDSVRYQVSEKSIDLIVMGTKGASGLKETIVGSNTGDVLVKIKCPTLVVPEKARFTRPREIVLPTDYNMFYEPSVLQTLMDIAAIHDSAVRVLHISKKEEELTEKQQEHKEFIKEYFSGHEVSFHQLTNRKLEDAIECFVQSRDIDMIAMVAKNLNFMEQILFRPAIEKISYHVKVPFLVLHE
ncbi:MAG: universal stress protein [Sinomicrobium sp.]|nr:universal stress protein [Sinomicrobium sp.]